jgi:stage II sporulation protein D
VKPLLLRSLPAHLCIFLLVAGCSRQVLVVPGTQAAAGKPAVVPAPVPPAAVPPPRTTENTSASRASPQSETELDFAEAFTDSASAESLELPPPVVEPLAESLATTAVPPPPPQEAPAEIQPPAQAETTLPSAFRIYRRMVRVALCHNVSKAVLYAPAEVEVHQSNSGAKAAVARGRINIEQGVAAGEVMLRSEGKLPLRVALPCTLMAREAVNYVEYDERSYRGSVMLTAGTRSTFSVVNFLDVEDYLRGVVPLEIGERERGDIEAVKAQAVAARTYTYRRMISNAQDAYDLLPDINDQVYKGVDAERHLCDLAIRSTQDLILVYRDSIIQAYYHSTCGGRTANVQDVWNKTAAPYLKSVADVDSKGNAYCAFSGYFRWDETWTRQKFSDIIARYAPQAYPGRPAPRGLVTAIKVTRRFACGRVGTCRITTTAGNYEYGGDLIRFVMRRNLPDHSILRSSRFEFVAGAPGAIRIHGSGYGHGVGMCQMGAIGRARGGQSFNQILSAYYPGTSLRLAKLASRD